MDPAGQAAREIDDLGRRCGRPDAAFTGEERQLAVALR
jgi:hypothetical protein